MLPRTVFEDKERRICRFFLMQGMQEMFSETPITDIIAWPEKGTSTTNAQTTTTTTRPASSTLVTTIGPPTTTITPTTMKPTTFAPTTTAPTTTAPTTSTPTTTTPTVTTPEPTTVITSTPTSSITTIATMPSIPPNEIFTACQLAEEISYISGKSVDWDTLLESWICLANMTTKFTNSYIQVSNTDPAIVYYGVFKVHKKINVFIVGSSLQRKGKTQVPISFVMEEAAVKGEDEGEAKVEEGVVTK
ncbi:integumentary mucin A.1-like [Folsomia candida]|uniref:integumentary mucin A.1-like n=1 Tax=Folsomia candida TaxID=158441 RepID=UPI001604B808|nr:integumentary mucin A.1-like [Folsomia candida]